MTLKFRVKMTLKLRVEQSVTLKFRVKMTLTEIVTLILRVKMTVTQVAPARCRAVIPAVTLKMTLNLRVKTEMQGHIKGQN